MGEGFKAERKKLRDLRVTEPNKLETRNPKLETISKWTNERNFQTSSFRIFVIGT
jgi:hypothetical protein